jgi:alpha-mannosidase
MKLLPGQGFALLISWLSIACSSSAQTLEPLFQIGVRDQGNSEFALAPKGYRDFKEDGFYVVGLSDAKQDWPYAQPGPDDSWGGSRRHTFTILFGLKTLPSTGESRLALDFLDTHAGVPPRLRATVNQWSSEKSLPAGGGDASIFGDASQRKSSRWEIKIPAGTLKTGENVIELTTVSGSWLLYDSLKLETPAGAELGPVNRRTKLVGIQVPPVWVKRGNKIAQPVNVTFRHVGDPTNAALRLGDAPATPMTLKNGVQTIELLAPRAERSRTLPLSLLIDGLVAATTNLVLEVPRVRELWLLPHSHVDIGYTHRQDEVIDVQIGNLEKAMQLAERSAKNKPGERFKWNPEAVWTLDHFLKRATAEQREDFLKAVRDGEVGVDALYGNMLTGLCRPEELAECLAFGARLSNLTGVPVRSASICDVPGYTWGIVPIMAQAGVKYFAIGPNFGDRVGTIHLWDNKPFYWKSQSGRDRVLCWVVDNYHFLGDVEQNVMGQLEKLQHNGFPYDISFLFWVGQWPNGGVDNAPPDEQLVEKVLAWNAKYEIPKVVIGLAGEYFKEFERRHGDELPEFSGDLTPYWEDGAGSTSRETALNRASGDRLSQASALFAMRNPKANPAAEFDEAWKSALLYSEHTWGAWCSISKPDDAFTVDQWRVKQSFALEADKQSRALLAKALPPTQASGPLIDVFNTTQWPRTDLAVIPQELAGEQTASVSEENGRALPSQRLSTGELVFLAREIPPFGARRFRLTSKPAPARGQARASGNTLETKLLRVELDPGSGAVKSLHLAGVKSDFVDPKAPVGLNDFRYLLGTDASKAKGNGPVKITVLEAGPLVAALRIESDAPGCTNLIREVRVVDGLDRVELINHVDRKSVREKDGVHFGFGFQVPRATLRMEAPWAVVQPNEDQLQGSCRNWFTVQRWVDVSGPDYGITWAPLDAPLMEIGGLTANLLGSVAFKEWMTNALESQTIYSWAQNNHWHTNYKIDQPGVTTFRYILRPHRHGYSAAESARFGIETTRPLLVASAAADQPALRSLLKLSSPEVLIETLKVSQDGKALMVRLFGVSGRDVALDLKWEGVKPASVWLSDLTEKPLKEVEKRLAVPAYDVVTLRAELE